MRKPINESRRVGVAVPFLAGVTAGFIRTLQQPFVREVRLEI